MLARQRLHVFLRLLFMLLCLFHCGLTLRDRKFKQVRRVTGGSRNKPTKGPPATKAPSIEDDLRLFNCNFDSGYCGWRNDTSAEFNWQRTSNETSTKDTGPPWDHTQAGVRGKGYYLYIETSLPREYGDKARLVSPTIHTPRTYCLTFWHHMHGSNVKDLNVYLKNGKSQKSVAVSRLSGPWSMENNLQTFAFGQDGDWWNVDNVQFTIDGPSQVIFEGVRGKNFRGDIAIDDISLSANKCPIKSINCNFENNTCGWTQMANDDFNWLPNRGGTTTRDTGPLHDHTLGNPDGRYLYIEASWPRAEGDKARLLSPPIFCDRGAKPVFNFWYNMNGIHVGPLRIYVTKDENRLGMPIWDLSGQQGEKWYLGQIPIPESVLTSGYFKIAIEGERKDYQGDTAIDDVSLVGCREVEDNFGDLASLTTPLASLSRTTTPRPTTARLVTVVHQSTGNAVPDGIECNFEKHNMCSWRQDDHSDHFDWELNQGGTHSERTGPSSDHTTRNGWYLFLEASEPRKAGDTAIVRSPSVDSSIHSCLSFYYHMQGKSMGKLEVLTSRRGGSRFERKWWISGQQSANDTDWKFAQVSIREAFNYEIVFRGVIGLGFYSDIAIDDISFQPVPCGKVQPKVPDFKTNDLPASVTPTSDERGEIHPLDCSFTAGNVCNWTQVNSPRDEFDWSFPNGTKTSSETGPEADHTTGSRDAYIYIEASTPRILGDRAILESPSFDAKSHMCFHIWYHMFGETPGELSIFRKIAGEDNMILEWTRKGDRGNMWLEGLVDIPAFKGRISLVIEAKRGRSWSGDIAIDDLTVTEGECETFGCDFENGTCDWKQETRAGNDHFDWIRNKGNTTSKKTGPSVDSTTRNESGHYMFIEASKPRARSDTARLISPVVDAGFNYSMCLKFWYHSFGKHIGAINIYKKNPMQLDGKLGDPLWYVDRDEGDQWLYGQKTISSADGDHLPFQIIFEGVRGSDYMGDVAIDDISLSDGKCEPCCGDDKFKCGNNFCIDESQRCNGIDNCWDGSDEAFCDNERTCGSPWVAPIIRQPEVLPENIVRDENPDNVHFIQAPVEDEELPTQDHVFPDLINEKEKGFGDRAPKISREQAKLIVHPKLGFDLVLDVGYYSENVYNSLSGASEKEAFIERRRRRVSPTGNSLRPVRKRSVGEEESSAHTKEDEPRQSYILGEILKEKSVKSQNSELEMIDLLQLQQNEKNILSGKAPPTDWQQRADIFQYTEKKRKIQATLGESHKVSDEQWELMTPSRRYMTEKEITRARRSVKKIVGGTASTKLNYPWQAAYYITDSGTKSHYFCGATLIDPYWVITAAHCPHLGDEHVIVLGDYDLFVDEGTEQECIVDALYLNQKYKFSEDLVADIALIQLRYPAKPSKSIIPACLLKPDDEPFPSGEICVSTGWGRVQSDKSGVERYLKHVEMPIISNRQCKNTFWSIFIFHDSYICAGGSGGNTCRGDSGGPLVCRRNDQFYLAGITSWGDTRCKPNIPGIYTRVQSYTDWMNKIMRYRTECQKE